MIEEAILPTQVELNRLTSTSLCTQLQRAFAVPENPLAVIDVKLRVAARVCPKWKSHFKKTELARVLSQSTFLQVALHDLRGCVVWRDEKRLTLTVRQEGIGVDSEHVIILQVLGAVEREVIVPKCPPPMLHGDASSELGFRHHVVQRASNGTSRFILPIDLFRS